MRSFQLSSTSSTGWLDDVDHQSIPLRQIDELLPLLSPADGHLRSTSGHFAKDSIHDAQVTSASSEVSGHGEIEQRDVDSLPRWHGHDPGAGRWPLTRLRCYDVADKARVTVFGQWEVVCRWPARLTDYKGHYNRLQCTGSWTLQELVCSVILYSILFYSSLFCSILFCSILFSLSLLVRSIILYSIIFRSVPSFYCVFFFLSTSVLLCTVVFYAIIFHYILSCSIIFYLDVFHYFLF